MTLRIGLLIDSTALPQWQRIVVEFIKKSDQLTLSLVVVNNAKVQNNSKLLYRLLRAMDRAIHKNPNDCFERFDCRDLLEGLDVISVKPTQTKFTDSFSDESIREIQSRQLDVMIRFGFRILKGDILRTAKFGVWSLHHGDSKVNRGGPPAFWEVVEKLPVTGVTLQILSGDLDGGRVISKSFIRTNSTSFYRNQVDLYWAGVELLVNTLRKFSIDRSLEPVSTRFYSNRLFKNPGNLKAFWIFLFFLLRRLYKYFLRLARRPRWSLYFAKSSGSRFETSLFRYKRIESPSGVDWADPFVIKHQDRYYLFFEELPSGSRVAHISFICLSNTGKLIEPTPTPIIQEAFHLSYPFIINYNGSYYLIPESATDNNVWLYVCEQFPKKWTKLKALVPNAAIYDPTLHFHGGFWYLFGTQRPYPGSSPDQYLHIYLTDDLLGGRWKPHPLNPITRDVRCARPAGRIFEFDGKLVRPVQLGAPNYGYGVRFMQITRLTPEEYNEEYFDEVVPHWESGLRAVHTFNVAEGLSVIDAQSA
ncbi:MAG: hypothetical protein AB7K37_14800 [Cyclobacteriaceae bacterium]